MLHPAFEDCPGHDIWKRDFKGSSGLFSVLLADHFTRDGLKNMPENMSLFSMGFSWGGYESLIVPFNVSDPSSASTN